MTPKLRTARYALLAGALLGAGISAQAQPTRPGEFVVIVHPANPSATMSRGFLAEVYLKRTTRWGDGELIRPVDLAASSPVRRRFSEDVLNRSVSAVRSYWQQLIFTGRGLPPVELDDDRAAVRFVLTHRGAVAYVSVDAELGRAKAVVLR